MLGKNHYLITVLKEEKNHQLQILEYAWQHSILQLIFVISSKESQETTNARHNNGCYTTTSKQPDILWILSIISGIKVSILYVKKEFMKQI